MTIREMRTRLGDTQSEFAKRYNIPFRTIQNWETGVRRPPEYMVNLLENRVQSDLINRKTITAPTYDPKKMDLPKSGDYLFATDWLQAVRDCIGENTVFALDDALICQGGFFGRMNEYVMWIYGDDSATRFNGVVVLGNQIVSRDVTEQNGLLYTNFNRTLADSFANEDILDMQGITEALSKYYFTHGESFDGIIVPPEYQYRFEQLAVDATEYYTS